MKKKFQILALLAIGLLSLASYAQGQNQKKSRVIELENYLTNQSVTFIKARFPDQPVIVSASVIPLLRSQQEVKILNQDIIPFDLTEGDEFVDEWDNPRKSIIDLFVRVQSISVDVTTSNSITESETVELRDALVRHLKLIPGRDQVRFERRDWAQEKEISWADFVVLITVLMLFLPAMFFSMRSAAKKVSQGINEVTAKMGSGPSSGASTSNTPAPKASTSTNNRSAPSGNLQFNDPIKIQEKLLPIIAKLSTDKNFPDFEDYLKLNTRISQTTQQTGAIICSFPPHIYEKLFALSHGEPWLLALTEPSEISMEDFSLLSRMAAKDRSTTNPRWEILLTCLWRMGDDLASFLQSVPQEEALSILSHMPSNISIPFGKRALPGAWAALLDSNNERPILSNTRIEQVLSKILATHPMRDPGMLNKYRHERGLLDYLSTATIADEREVYEASNSDSTIHELRPPFYIVTNANPETFSEFAQKFTMDHWAMAFYNIDRSKRQIFDSVLTDKQKYLFIEELKRLDRQGVSEAEVGNMREHIAVEYHNFTRKMALESQLKDATIYEETSENAA